MDAEKALKQAEHGDGSDISASPWYARRRVRTAASKLQERRWRLLLALMAGTIWYMIDGSGPRTWSSPAFSAPSASAQGPSALAVCKQYPAWSPPSQSNFSLPAPLPTSTYAKLLSGAVQIDTTVPDSWGPLNAPNISSTVRENYRKAFAPFEAYLSRSFPLVHSVLTKEVVDSHGLIFTWRGSDESLKPLVLMAHQDVVPVEPSTVGRWVHNPFSGWVDEENGVVWGRGSSDDKGERAPRPGRRTAADLLLSLTARSFTDLDHVSARVSGFVHL